MRVAEIEKSVRNQNGKDTFATFKFQFIKHYLFGSAFLLPYFRKDGDVMANYKSLDEKTKQAFE